MIISSSIQLLLLVSFCFDMVLCQVHYIVPTDSEPCFSAPCLTLSQFAESPTNYSDSNITLFIAGGNHDLDRAISLSNKEQIFILSINDSTTGSVITCSTNNAHLNLKFSSQVRIQGIEFVGCDGNIIRMVGLAYVVLSRFTNSSGTALTIIDSHANVQTTSFSSNMGKSRNEPQIFRYLQMTVNTNGLGSISAGGALIMTNSTLLCELCQFNGNSANVGGAIFMESGSNATIRNSLFTSNHALNCHNTLCLGGAVYADMTLDTNIIIHNCSFQNNTSYQYGGGVVIITNRSHVSYDVHNATNRRGVSLSVVASSFTNNNAMVGGAIYLHNSNVTIFNCTFQYSKARMMGGIMVANASSFVTLNSSYIAFNEAKYGGVVSIHQYSTVDVERCNLEHNTARDNGGAVFAELNSTAIFQSCEFTNNSVQGGEGGVAVLIMKSSAIISDSVFSNNSATSGGVVYAQMISSVVIHKSSFDGNRVNRDGAVVFLFERSNITVIEGDFIENQAGMEGGAIKARNWSSITVRNCTFSHNSASIYGGALHIKVDSVAFVYDSQFDGNIANDGGTINAYLFSTIEVYSSIFSNNKANITGGVISSKLNSSSFIVDSKFQNNSAFDIGAVIYTEDHTNVSVNRSFFANNSAIYGGAVAIRRHSTAKVNNCTGGSNSARVDGGFLYSRTNSKSAISNCSFTKNIAKNNGIVVASDSSSITIDTSVFINNTVGHDGAVAFVHDRGSAIINNCNFIGNWANNSGGVVYTRRHCTLTIINGYFYNNTAENSGGVVCIQGDSKVSIEDSNFTDNKADYGGVVRMYIRSKMNISDCHFSNNEANIGGGIVATYKYSIVAIQSSQFILNIASYGGVLIAYQSSTVILDNVSCLHNRARSGGVIRTIQGSKITVNNGHFSYNIADIGGVLNTQHGVVVVKSSQFEHNSARLNGGALYTDDSSNASIHTATFWNNTAESDGGAIGILESSVEILEDSNFTNNQANGYGGVINVQNSSINISDAVFEYSISGRSGGVVCSKNSSISISACSFTNNNASKKGGALTVYSNSTLTVLNSTFMHNAASDSGGALYLAGSSRSIIGDTKFHYNRAEECGGAIIASTQTAINITKSVICLNTAKKGAGLTASLNSSISFDISLTDTQICENNATLNGGGILLTDSILYFIMNTTICYNVASKFGGGLFALNSDIIFGSSVVFDRNRAMHGGGASLAISKLISYTKIDERIEIYAKFVMNRASSGGALYVNDSTDNTTCSTSGCFFQNVTKHLQLFFKDNYAEHSGHNLFGGLLDRCTAISNPVSAEPKTSGIARFQEISNVRNLSTVSSEPVRVCPCENNVVNCSLQTHNVSVKQGNPFTIQLSAVDQVYQSVSATIQSELKEVSLPKNQTIQRIDSQCSNLDYQAFFPSVSEIYKLIIYARGPCDSIGISNLTVNIKVLKCSCGPGFMREDLSTKCLCVCDKRDKVFSTYIKECNSSIDSVIRKGVFWITYLNNSESEDNSSSRYFIYPYCPLGYCQSPSKSVPVNLSQPNGSDAQCAHNRSGLLCGRCKPNFSLSLGSSKCISCPRNWQVLLAGIIIAAFFAGILLVFIILMLNLTVAVGAVNSIIFYANIIYANRSIFFNHWQLQQTFASVFVSWLNLDIGFDVCFYKGMDVYVKTWLQLAFPFYILLLVIIIIWISAYSSRLSNLLGRRNPVATLATLMLLSYTKLLEAIINSFSFVTLNYPNGTITINWLPDANMVYSSWKLILLICSATSVILTFGLLYTVLIFSWQWLVKYSRSKLLKWAGNQKLHLFIDSYHIPLTTKHRYWTGLLLLVRVIIYLISAFSASINPRISLLSTVTIICCLFLYKSALMIRVYKNWLLNAMESFTFFNIVVFVFFTWYTFDDPSNTNKELLQTTIAYISVGAMLFLFLLVILFHVYRYGNARVYALFQNTKFIRKARHHILAHADSTSSHGSHYRLFDYIDNPRSDNDDADDSANSIPFVPTRTTISLTDCDESSIKESHTD